VVTGLAADLTVRRDRFTLQLPLTVEPGEVVVLLGPNGAGKSTALRALAGLLALDAGRIVLDDRVLADPEAGLHEPAHRRPIGVVFQDYLLFPHLSVLDNVAFGPHARGVGRSEARRRALGWLERVGIADLAPARPRSVSGGQAQRVALARALVLEPALLLLDEPLAALDARTRLQVRAELRRHLAGFAGATVVVTHDPVDAAVLGDRLVVVEQGEVVQSGRPADVARQPRTDYVARLVGLNLLAGRADGRTVALPAGGRVTAAEPHAGEVYAAFRPAAVALFLARPDGSPRNVWPGRVAGLEPHGDGVRIEVGGAPDPASTILAEVTPAAVADLGLVLGTDVWAAVKASDIDVYPRWSVG
jgi:molybdate transport system ATP-binding protein